MNTLIKATLCYIIKDGKVLLVYGDKPYAPHYLLYNAPGGKFEKEDGGDPDKCNLRECREEAGVEPIDPVFLGIVTFFGFSGPNNIYRVWVYRADDYRTISRPEKKVRWFSAKPVSALLILPVDKLVHVPLVVAGKYFTAEVHYQGRKFTSYLVKVLDQPPPKE